MIELMLWREDMGGDRRITVDPERIVYYSAVEKKVLFGGYNECTKITLVTGESFVVTACYDAVQRAVEQALGEKRSDP